MNNVSYENTINIQKKYDMRELDKCLGIESSKTMTSNNLLDTLRNRIYDASNVKSKYIKESENSADDFITKKIDILKEENRYLREMNFTMKKQMANLETKNKKMKKTLLQENSNINEMEIRKQKLSKELSAYQKQLKNLNYEPKNKEENWTYKEFQQGVIDILDTMKKRANIDSQYSEVLTETDLDRVDSINLRKKSDTLGRNGADPVSTSKLELKRSLSRSNKEVEKAHKSINQKNTDKLIDVFSIKKLV